MARDMHEPREFLFLLTVARRGNLLWDHEALADDSVLETSPARGGLGQGVRGKKKHRRV